VICEKLKSIKIYNDTLRSYVQKYLSLTINSYRLAIKKGYDSKEWQNDYKKYKAFEAEYFSYLASTCATSRFINMSEEKYGKTIDKNNYIKDSNYKEYVNLKKTDLRKSLTILTDIANKTKDFQEYSIYQIELADQYVKHSDTLDDLGDSIALEKYKAILDKKKYSIYLYEAWLKWRTVYQQNHGLSKFSEIPNDDYNKVREEQEVTILNYIIDHRTDEMGINQFLLLATEDIVRRFGQYPYGNQNTVAFHQLFDEK
jgi:hypothetical protein